MKKKEIKKLRDELVRIIIDSKATFFCKDKKSAKELNKDFEKCQDYLHELKAEICTNVEFYFLKLLEDLKKDY